MNIFITLILLLSTFIVSNAYKNPHRFDPNGKSMGEATFYRSDGSNGHCSYKRSKTQLFAALPTKAWKSSLFCGACALVKGPKGSVTVKIVDSCPDKTCIPGDLDLSPKAFSRIAPLHKGRVPITWKFTTCSGIHKEPIRVDWKKGSNQWWYGIQIIGFGRPILSIKVNGKKLNRAEYNYFIGKGKGPFRIDVYGSGKHVSFLIGMGSSIPKRLNSVGKSRNRRG